MTTIVIMPGGFHPFHAGHYALYQSARRTFPDAEVYVAATNDTSTRPFPFPVKEKLAKLAGVEPGHFVQVKSPFKAEEITAQFDPNKDQLIFVRSEKDSTKPPQPGGVKKDGSPAYLQPLLGAKRLQPFAKHAYMAYLPTVEFGPGMTSATEIRNEWPTLDKQGKLDRVMSLYPRTQGNAKLAATVVGLLDAAIGGEQGVSEDRLEEIDRRGFLRGLGAAAVAGAAGSATAAPFRHSKTVDPMTDKVQGRNSTVVSDDGSARLYIQWNDGIWFDLNQGLIGFDSVSGRIPVQSMRIKIGNSPVEGVVGVVNKNFKSLQIGGIFDSNDTKAWAHRILKHSGELRLEVLLANGNKKVFKFTIEPDSTTRDFAAKQKQQDIQPSTAQKNNVSAAPSASYVERLKGRIMPNVTGQSAGPVEVEINAGSDGTITSKRLVKSSGDSNWDQSVLQGIDKIEVLPKDTDGRVPSSITVTLGESKQGVAEGAPIVVMPRADRLKKPEPTKVRYQGDIVPDTKPASTEKRGVKGRPGQRPMPKYDVAETSKQKGVVGREYDRDPELRQAMLYAKQHYPQHANDPEQAMLKWLQRGLNHSEQEDRQHDRRIAQLNSKVSALIASITQLKQQQSQSANESNDYVDE